MSDTYDRREFLAGPVRWAAAAGLLSSVAPPLLAQAPAPRDGATIITRTLGRTGISLPIVNMGVMNADLPGLIRKAYDVGIRHFDTAAHYQGGRNEEMVGAMIKEMGVRDQVTISTKAMPFYKGGPAAEARDLFRHSVEASLKRLQMDHVDILYFHAVDSAEIARSEGPIQALTELKKEGKTRFTGFSSHRGEAVLDEAVRLGVYDVALVTFNFTMASNTALINAIDRAAKAGMGIVAMKTQAGGGPGRGRSQAGPPRNQTALLKWVLRHQSIATAIPGYTQYPQIDENFSVASNLEYTPAEAAYLSEKSTVASLEFCQYCGQCLGDCPRGVDVPSLMRSHMYAVQYGNLEMADSTLGLLEPGKGLDACGDCGTCQTSCRNAVDIGGRIAGLKALPLHVVA